MSTWGLLDETGNPVKVVIGSFSNWYAVWTCGHEATGEGTAPKECPVCETNTNDEDA